MAAAAVYNNSPLPLSLQCSAPLSMLLSLLLNAPLSPSSINVLPSPSCLLNNRAPRGARSFIKTFWSKVPKLLPETPNLASSLIEASGYSTRTISQDRSAPNCSGDPRNTCNSYAGDPRNICNPYAEVLLYLPAYHTHAMSHIEHNAPYTPCPISHSAPTQ